MRYSDRSVCVAAVILAMGSGCSFPTDKSDAVVVAVQAPRLVVIRGQELPVHARALHVSGGDTLDVQNTVFQWSSSNTSLATVQGDGGDSARVTGVNPGTVIITARAVAFERATVGSVQVRVSNPLEVDSVRPSLVRFGDTITVYGVGVDSIILAFLDDAAQFDYPIPALVPTRTRDSLGFSAATFWVTPPARTAPLSFIGPGVFGNAPDTTRVLPFDVFEPNETAPRNINLEAAPRWPALAWIKFMNPALAFEIPRRDEIGIEWYRFSQTTSRDVTLIISGPDVRGTFSTFLTDSLRFEPADTSYRLGPSSWTIGPGSHFCGGIPFEPAQTQPESTIVALRGMPAGRLHALAFYAQPGRYNLAVFEGYTTSNPAVPADNHEEDDFCDAAIAQGLVGTLPGQLRDTLTIDNPHDVDWLPFAVGGATPLTVRFRVATLVPGDTVSDVDLYVLSNVANGLVEQGSGIKNGSNEDFIAVLAPGQYFAVVVDYAGVPVPYTYCIDSGAGCAAAFPSAPVGGGAARERPIAAPAPTLQRSGALPRLRAAP